jgi:hypothetical protein
MNDHHHSLSQLILGLKYKHVQHFLFRYFGHLWMTKWMSVQYQISRVLIQVMYLMIPDTDILGIKCRVSDYSQLISA